MEPHAVKSYASRFDGITETLAEMGAHVRVAIEIAGQALAMRDEALRQRAKENDKQINRLNERTLERINEMLATQHPMASDLRYVVSALRIAGALERAGDLAKGVVKRMARLHVEFPATTREAMRRQIEVNLDMLEGALAALRARDAKQALAVWKRDDEADQLCRDVFQAVLTEMPRDPVEAPHLVDILFAAKNLERMADYIVAVAKAIHYVETGETPKKALLDEI